MDEKQRYELAQRIINNPLWKDVWDTYREEIKDRWENSTTGASNDREGLWMALKITNRVRSEIEQIFTMGQAEKAKEGNNGKRST